MGGRGGDSRLQLHWLNGKNSQCTYTARALPGNSDTTCPEIGHTCLETVGWVDGTDQPYSLWSLSTASSFHDPTLMSVVCHGPLYFPTVQFPRLLDVYSRDNICLCHRHEIIQYKTDYLQISIPVSAATDRVVCARCKNQA